MSGQQGKCRVDVAFPASVPAAVAIEVIAFLANAFNRPGFGSSDFDSARISDANSSAAVRVSPSVTAGSARSIASARARACSTFC
jgi:hypothetical protein